MQDTVPTLDQEKENPVIPELFMQTVAAHEFFFTKARNILEQDGGISNDLELLQKEFSNLKDSFFLLETKLGMLERLSTQTAFDSVTPASITQLGVDVSEAKKRLSSIKREMELLKARLREVVDDLAKKTRELAQSKAEFEKVRKNKFAVSRRGITNDFYVFQAKAFASFFFFSHFYTLTLIFVRPYSSNSSGI